MINFSIRDVDVGFCQIFLESDKGTKACIVDVYCDTAERAEQYGLLLNRSYPTLHGHTDYDEPSFPSYGTEYSIPDGKGGVWTREDIYKFKDVSAIIDALIKNQNGK